MNVFHRIAIVCCGIGAGWSGSVWAEPIDFESQVRPILATHCFGCHGEKKQKGDLRLDTLSVDLASDRPAAETWHDVRDALNLGEMPPDDEPELKREDRRVLVEWINQEIDALVRAQKDTGGRVVLRRLNRSEYQNTMRDLLGIEMDFAKDLPPESLSEDGFTNEGATLQMTDMQLDTCLQAARRGLAKAIVTGPEPEVFSYEFTKSSVGSRKKNQGSNILSGSQEFIGKMMKYPEEGEFLVRVKARAKLVDGKSYPQLRVALGHRADTKGPRGHMKPVDVSSESWQLFEFRDRVEHFPLPSVTQSKFPGLLVTLDSDGGTAGGFNRQKDKNRKGKGGNSLPHVEVESVEFIAPLFDQWPPAHHTAILFPSKVRTTNEAAYAGEVLRRFMSRAFRRPVARDEVTVYRSFYETVRGSADSIEEAMRETLAMVLVSPEFLYLVEPAAGAKRPITDWELASRLSYFLWSTMPDERLRSLAAEGDLKQPKVLRGEVRRMLADERSWQFVERFAGEWLDVGAVDRVAVNPEFYPDFDNDLKESMKGETLHFFHELLSKNLSALNILESDFTMVDGPLAGHYGLKGPRGSQFERVDLKPGDRRGGVLTHGSVLLGNSTGNDSHPIKRAVWIRERLLDDPPADPPPNVPSLDLTNPDFARLPVREQLRLHREEASCTDCHRGIDPWGIALEHYGGDALWRDRIGGEKKPAKGKKNREEIDAERVVAKTTLPDGSEVDGLGSLKAYLMKQRREQFAKAFTSKLFSYGLGRRLELIDEKAVDGLAEDFAAGGYRIGHLIELIATSEEFLSK